MGDTRGPPVTTSDDAQERSTAVHVCSACDRVIDFSLGDADPVPGRPRYVHRTAADCARARPVALWDVHSLRRLGADWDVDTPDALEALDELDAEEGMTERELSLVRFTLAGLGG